MPKEETTAKLKKRVADLEAAAAQGQLVIAANAAAAKKYKSKKAEVAALHADSQLKLEKKLAQQQEKVIELLKEQVQLTQEQAKERVKDGKESFQTSAKLLVMRTATPAWNQQFNYQRSAPPNPAMPWQGMAHTQAHTHAHTHALE